MSVLPDNYKYTVNHKIFYFNAKKIKSPSLEDDFIGIVRASKSHFDILSVIVMFNNTI